jgi:hypothetical protein
MTHDTQLLEAIEAAWEKRNLSAASLYGGELLLQRGKTTAEQPHQNISALIQRMTKGYAPHEGHRGIGPFFERVPDTDQIRPLYPTIEEILRRAGLPPAGGTPN